jgi:hypothetical protein
MAGMICTTTRHCWAARTSLQIWICLWILFTQPDPSLTFFNIPNNDVDDERKLELELRSASSSNIVTTEIDYARFV